MVGLQVLRQISDMYRKLRGTLRFLPSNLHDWKIIQCFAIVDLPNFYFDIAKDQLYVGGKFSFTRTCQTVLAAHLSIVKVIAPVLSCLTEDVWQNLPFDHVMEDGSVAKFVFELKWPDLNGKWLAIPADDVDFWNQNFELRSEVNKVLENARIRKLIGSSLEAKVYLQAANGGAASNIYNFSGTDPFAAYYLSPSMYALSDLSFDVPLQVEILTSLNDEIISNITYAGRYSKARIGELWIGVTHADGAKCERCLNYSPLVGSFIEHPYPLCSVL
ncbi:isoleucine--tRNA ligase, chloroplastic/mitochondrial-like isoform X2 [Typha latifolia]